MNSRTIRDFYVPTNIWPTVERWAEKEGFRLLDDDGIKRRYQKGLGLLILPTMFEMSLNEGNVHLEVWVKADMLNRIVSMFILPEESKLDSGGFAAILPRNVSREAVNRLMVQIGQPLIT
jgi:hypothetical protein